MDGVASSTVLREGWIEVIDENSGLPYYYNEITKVTQWDLPIKPLQEDSVSSSSKFFVDQDLLVNDSSDLPQGWEQLTDESTGLSYYIHTEKKITQWQFPERSVTQDSDSSKASQILSQGLILPSGWVQLVDDHSGKAYYFHERDSKTQWEPPSIEKKESSELSKTPDDRVIASALSDLSLRDKSHSDLNQDSPIKKSLPLGWKALEDSSSGNIYYFNESKNITTWDIPTVNSDLKDRDDNLKSRPRPPHALVRFGFGGKLLIMKPQLAERLGIDSLSGGEPTLRKGPVELRLISSIMPERFLPVKSNKSIPFPLLAESDVDVNLMLESMSGNKDSDGELLWNLISIASKWKGRLRSAEGVSNPNGPEAEVVNLLLNSKYILPNPSPNDVIHLDIQDSKICMIDAQKLLLRGKREEAVKCALTGGNYGLALLIASFCGPETYHTAMKYFIRKELASGTPLYTATSLFANQIETHSELDDDCSSFWKEGSASLEHSWRYHLATILNNQTRGWKKIVIALGDELLYSGNTAAAHFCYLASGRPISSPEDLTSRLVLIGCDHRIRRNLELFTTDGIEAYFRTEALEWAKRKGNPLAVITAFQPFKLKYAMILADHGFQESALSYIKSIRKCTGLNALGSGEDSSISSIRSIYPKDFLENLDIFEDRLYMSQGKINPTIERRKQSSMFALSGVLSKVVSTTKKDENVTGSVVNIDGSFDHDMNPNDSYVSASSNFHVNMDNQIASDSTSSKSSKKYMAPVEEDQLQKVAKQEQERFASIPSVSSTPNRPSEDAPSIPRSNYDLKNSTPTSMSRNTLSPVASTSTATPASKKPIVEAPSSASSWSIGNWLTKKLNPDATQADIGGEMEAYYDEKLKRWIFPGDDPAEVAKPLAPPPTTPIVKDHIASTSTPTTNDPLASLMAPPTRGTPNTNGPPTIVGSRTPISGPPRIPRSTHAMAGKIKASTAPPQFVIFQPKKDNENEREE